MAKNYKKIGFVAILVCLGVVLGFYFFNLGPVKASPGTVEFTTDVILDLPGLTETVYIASGSKCDNLIISGTDLTVNEVFASPDYFLLKTIGPTGHKVLEITPSGGTADFVFSSNNVSGGYINQWNEKSSVSVGHIVGVPSPNTDYVVVVRLGAVEVDRFTIKSSAGDELNFNRTGSGNWETYTIEPPPCRYHNVYGFAWVGVPQAVAPEKLGLGWISFSCRDTMAEGTGVDYGVGVDVDPVTGYFSGYAYFDMNDPNTGINETGWIRFDPLIPPVGDPDRPFCPVTTCPTGSPNYLACLDLPGAGQVCDGAGDWTVTGWARVCNVFQTGCSGALKADSERGGWDGWILLGPIIKGGTDYGVYIDTALSPAQLKNWAWGSDVIGWISFNRLNCDPDKDGFSNGAVGCPSAGTVVANYKVMTDFSINQRPDQPTNLNESWGYCGGIPSVNTRTTLTLNWSGDIGDTQQAYEVEIAGNSYVASAAGSSYSVNPSNHGFSSFTWGNTYNWRVRVQDNNDNWSDWSNYDSFTMPIHQAPNPSFTLDPTNPPAGVGVQFTNTTTFYDGEGSYFWTFQDGTPASSEEFEPTVTFASTGPKIVTLTATDSDGYSCPASVTIGVRLPLPTWREIPPTF